VRGKTPAIAPAEEGAIEDWSSDDEGEQETLTVCFELLSWYSRAGMPVGTSERPVETLSDAMPQPPRRHRTTVRKCVVKKIPTSLGRLPRVSILELVVE
jgi:hypothetical protein